MYFFFGLKYTVSRSDNLFAGSTTIYMGQGKSDIRYPWWVGNSDFTVVENFAAYFPVANQATCTAVDSAVFEIFGSVSDIFMDSQGYYCTPP